jgi:Fe2+ transport system protein FeoA
MQLIMIIIISCIILQPYNILLFKKERKYMDKFDACSWDANHGSWGGGRWRHGHRGLWGRADRAAQRASELVLSETSSGEEYVFIALRCDTPAFRGRMMSLGLMPGTRLRVLEGGRGRPFLVEINRGGKFMLDAKSAAMITVRRVSAVPEGGAQ